MKQSKSYPNIDMLQTGLQLKLYMDRAGMSVKDIQCPLDRQTILLSKTMPEIRANCGKTRHFVPYKEKNYEN